MQTALISFLANSINTRLLSAYLKQNGFGATCYFCPGPLDQVHLDSLTALLKEKNTSLVCISLVTDNYASAVQVTRAVKEKLGIPVCWGGAHVNIKPEESLRHADLICLGEGEDALLELHRSLVRNGKPDTGIKNIWFKTDKGIVRNGLRDLEEDLDKYPFPDFDISSQYVLNGAGFARFDEKQFNSEYSIMTSRGCPYSCRYCYNSYRRKQYEGKGKYLRTRSVENVIAELKMAKARFPGLQRVNFWDDSFVARKMEDFVKFRELYREHIGLPFFALIEPMAFNAEKIEVLKESGLAELQIGIQTGSERVNKQVYNRPISNQKVVEVAQAVHRMGIRASYDLIFNNPYETVEDIKETIGLLLQFPRPFSLQGYNLIFYPGTDITESALRDGYIACKPEMEDFSTIQGAKDSPTVMLGRTEVSGRLYSINYDSRDKEYWNSVVSLFILKSVPYAVIRYFARSATGLKKAQLKMFVALYMWAAGVKNSLRKTNKG